MDEVWSYEHSVECPVRAEFAWRFWTDVRNWAMDADVESVELDGAFATGARGATITRSRGRVEWQIGDVEPGRSAIIVFPVEGAVAQVRWTFEDLGERTRLTQRIALAGEGADKLIPVVAPMVEANTPAGMQKLCEAISAASDPFPGVWELDASTLDYQRGRPGRRAVYSIARLGDGLQFTLDADDADGKPMHHVYGGRLDGAEVAIAGTPFVLVMQRPDRDTIESILKKDGQVVDRWTRTMQADGRSMIITQHGFLEDGSPFRNCGTYRRRG
jgi:hypothetical protein